MYEAIVFEPKDNVATATRKIEKGTRVIIGIKGSKKKVEVNQKIPLGHKFALQDLKKGQNVVKYGEVIGRAKIPIKKGEHVHVHNVEE